MKVFALGVEYGGEVCIVAIATSIRWFLRISGFVAIYILNIMCVI